jgi:hypothetical protein
LRRVRNSAESTPQSYRRGEVDDPLAHTAPTLVAVDWNNGTLTLTLDRPVHDQWVQALYNMGNYASIMGAEPQRFQFSGREARVGIHSSAAQMVINHFKEWLPRASQVLKFHLEQAAQAQARQQADKLRREKAAEEERLRLLQTLKI